MSILSSTGSGEDEEMMNVYSFLPSAITVFTETNTMSPLVFSACDNISADISIIKHYLTFR